MIQIKDISIIVLGLPDDFVWRVADIFSKELELRFKQNIPIKSAPAGEGYEIFLGIEIDIKKTLPNIKANLDAIEMPGLEGFKILRLEDKLIIAGADDRGCLYGMGYVLRKLVIKKDYIALTDEIKNLSITPKYPLRGHQLAYRDKQNTCPGWDLEDFDRYIRDLAIFGSNAIEILPLRTDDRLFSPKFRKDPMEMMIALSELIHSYGMDVWIWYPNMGKDYDSPMAREEELEERRAIYSALPYVDCVLVPAGDPGELEPKDLFPVVEESTKILHEFHPNAKVWIAPQVFAPRQNWHEEFYQELSKEPHWLYGLCYAPWMYETIDQFYDNVPEKYKSRIRHYPDMTHNSSSQFEMGDWDLPFALVNGRESYNTRPRAMKHMHNLYAPYTMGSLTYSEGIHDDVNKMIWTDQDFDPSKDVEETLRDYVRLFIDPDLVDEMVPLLLAFEDSWVGYAKDNEGIDKVHASFEKLASSVKPEIRDNYRFKMAYLRALTDYFAKYRSIYDLELESKAYKALSKAENTGADNALIKAWNILGRTFDEPIHEEISHKIQQLADELYNTPGCRIQLTTTFHKGQSWIRGSYVDAVKMPLNDYQFITQHLDRILNFSSEEEKLTAINWLIHRRDPGEKGRYINLGDLKDFKDHVINTKTWEEDPGFLRSAVVNSDPYGIGMVFNYNRHWHSEFPISLDWIKRARVIYGTPLTVRFDGLDKGIRYKLKVTYPDVLMRSEYGDTKIKLMANGRLIHDSVPIRQEQSYNPVFEYELPENIVSDDELILTWEKWGKLDRVSVSEVWLMVHEEGIK